MEENAESLLNQNPRDSLILRRKNNLAARLAARDKVKHEKRFAKAKKEYDNALKSFAPEYLAVQDQNVFDSLSKQEKNALSKIYESSCWRWLITHTSILTAFSASFAYMGVIYMPGFFVVLIVALFLYGISGLWELPMEYINFIKSRRTLLKHQKDLF